MKVKLTQCQEKTYLHDEAFRKSYHHLEEVNYAPQEVVNTIEELCDINTRLLKELQKLLLKKQ